MAHKDSVMGDPKIYRRYAEECRRLAKEMAQEHRATLPRLAKAWISGGCRMQEAAKTGMIARGIFSTAIELVGSSDLGPALLRFGLSLGQKSRRLISASKRGSDQRMLPDLSDTLAGLS